MIVIATNNGSKYMPNLISSIETYGPHDEKYLIVDTGSTDPEYKQYLETLPSTVSFDLEITSTPYKGYDTGAYIWAYRNYEAEEYMFLQDSLVIKEESWLDRFRSKFSEGRTGLVAWAVFDGMYDTESQKQFVERAAGTSHTKGWGVFGPIFYTTKEAMDKFDKICPLGLGKAIPTNKDEQMGMERGWAAICNAAGLDHGFIHIHVHNNMLANKYNLFNKVLPFRL